MRTYIPSEIPREFDPRLVKILREMGSYLKQVDAGFGAIVRGANPIAGGGGGDAGGGLGLTDHHKLTNLTVYDDHSQYAYLLGRRGGQVLYGAVPTLGDVAGTWLVAGDFVHTSTKTPASTWSAIPIATSASVGDFIVLHLGTAPFTTNFNGASSNHSTLTDTKGNIWTKIKEFQYSDGSLNGTCTSVWTCTVTAALTAGVDTLTAAYSASIPVMGIASERFLSNNGTPVIAGIAALGEQDFTGNGPSILTLSGLSTSTQYLFARVSVIGNAGSAVTTPYTASTNYTIFNHSGTATAGGTGNIGVYGEYRLVSLISDTTNPAAGAGGIGGYYVSIYYALVVFPTVTGGLTLAANILPNTAKVDAQSSLLYLYGHDIYFRDVATGTDLSRIRTSLDGAFIGPIVPTPNFELLNTTLFSDVTAATVVRGDLITGQGVTPKWAHLTRGAATTLLQSDGTDINWSSSSLLNLGIAGTAFTLTIGQGTTGVDAANLRIRSGNGSGVAIPGLFLARGTTDVAKLIITNGTQTDLFVTGSFRINDISDSSVTGLFSKTAYAFGVSGTGFSFVVGQGAAGTDNGQLIVRSASGVGAAAILDWARGDNTSLMRIKVDNTGKYWEIPSGIYITDAVSGAARALILTTNSTCRIRLGDSASPAHSLEIVAGTTSRAPFKLTSGVNLTTAIAGCLEFTTDDLFFTITTGAARKAVILDDGTRLTSGRVPFATTNGRLIDDADMTFAVDTLTITKIAATTLTGDLTFADAINIVLNGTTGTKIGTATTQKIGFWNTAPVVQPTTSGAAATLIGGGGTALTDTDTFDGYTLKQVVKALRTVGILA